MRPTKIAQAAELSQALGRFLALFQHVAVYVAVLPVAVRATRAGKHSDVMGRGGVTRAYGNPAGRDTQ